MLVVVIKGLQLGNMWRISPNRLGDTGLLACFLVCFVVVVPLLDIWCSLGNEVPEIEPIVVEGQ